MIAHEDASPRREEKETYLLRGVSRMNGGVEFQEWKARIAERNRRRVEARTISITIEETRFMEFPPGVARTPIWGTI